MKSSAALRGSDRRTLATQFLSYGVDDLGSGGGRLHNAIRFLYAEF